MLISTLLFGSGACAIVYQTVWLREFRMIFWRIDRRVAAVLAVFMGGLGAGGLVLGRKVDLKERPLRFYAHLELLIAVVVALSPAILWLVRAGYFALWGRSGDRAFCGYALPAVACDACFGTAHIIAAEAEPVDAAP